MKTVYHAGEIAVQTQAGVRDMAARVAGGIHEQIPPAAAAFLLQQPMAIIGSVGNAGAVWASLLTGEPGFMRALDAATVQINARPASGDPLTRLLADTNLASSLPLQLGLLAIEPATRKRMRLNGEAEVSATGALLLHAREVYANCPKYIQARELVASKEEETADEGETAAKAQTGASLTASQQEWIARADTFFIASAARDGGADASHRGGMPGFVHVVDASWLEFPDYAGNTMFNTLGNITANPNVGLLFVDFETGATLQITGQAAVIWEPKRVAQFAGAERAVAFHITQTVQIQCATPLRFRFQDYSRFNPI